MVHTYHNIKISVCLLGGGGGGKWVGGEGMLKWALSSKTQGYKPRVYWFWANCFFASFEHTELVPESAINTWCLMSRLEEIHYTSLLLPSTCRHMSSQHQSNGRFSTKWHMSSQHQSNGRFSTKWHMSSQHQSNGRFSTKWQILKLQTTNAYHSVAYESSLEDERTSKKKHKSTQRQRKRERGRGRARESPIQN